MILAPPKRPPFVPRLPLSVEAGAAGGGASGGAGEGGEGADHDQGAAAEADDDAWEDGGDGRRYRRALASMERATSRFRAAPPPKPTVSSPLQSKLQAALRSGGGGREVASDALVEMPPTLEEEEEEEIWASPAHALGGGGGGGGGGGEGGAGVDVQTDGEVPSWLRPSSRPSSRPRSRSAHTPRGGKRAEGPAHADPPRGTPYTPYEPYDFAHDDQSVPGSGVRVQEAGQYDRLVLESRDDGSAAAEGGFMEFLGPLAGPSGLESEPETPLSGLVHLPALV